MPYAGGHPEQHSYYNQFKQTAKNDPALYSDMTLQGAPAHQYQSGNDYKMSKVNHKMDDIEDKIRLREAEIEAIKKRQTFTQVPEAGKVTAPYA
jgi:hypothetical protein